MMPLARDLRIGVMTICAAALLATSASHDLAASLDAVRNVPGLTGPAYLKANNTGSGDVFGNSVAVSGNTLVVGAPFEDGGGPLVNPASNELVQDAGAAYVFVRNGSTWNLQAYLKASNPTAQDLFGSIVVISGNTIAVKTRPTVVSIFVRSGSTWTLEAEVPAIAHSLALSGNTLVVGNFNVGAFVFVRNGTTWSQQAFLTASNQESQDFLGYSVGISGDTIVVGAFGESGSGTGVDPPSNNDLSQAGAAYVFVRTGTTWTQQAYLKASNPDSGDLFGWSVAVSGNTVVVGAWGEDGPDPVPDVNHGGYGAAYVFVRNGTTWAQQAYLRASNPGGGYQIYDYFGWSVAVSGNTVVVGAEGEDGSGSGVNPNSNEGANGAGAAYVFVRSGTVWSQHAYLKASNPGGADALGEKVGVSGNTIIVGSGGEDGAGLGVNPPSDEGASTAGAAYVFDAPTVPPLVHFDLDTAGDALVYGPSSGTWSRMVSSSGGGFIEQTFGSWSSGWSVSPANFSGDDLTDFFLYNTTTGAWTKILATATGFTTESSGSWWQGWQRYVMELDGDGISDVFLYDVVTGQWFKCISTPTGFTYIQGGWNPGWELYPMAFDADGLSDLFLFNRSTGGWFVVVGQPGPSFSYPRSGAWYAGWQLYPGDFNADGLSDLLLHDPPSGNFFIATTGGSGFSYVQGGWSPGWKPYVADLDADDRDDVFLHDATTGGWHEMISNVFGTFDSAGGGFWSLGWQLYPTDFNGDRRADLLLYDPNNGAWYQALNLANGSLTYTNGSWTPGLTIVTRAPGR